MKLGSHVRPDFGSVKIEAQEIFWGPILDNFWGEACLEILLGPAKSRSRVFLLGSKGLRERSKRPKGGLQQQPRTEDAI